MNAEATGIPYPVTVPRLERHGLRKFLAVAAIVFVGTQIYGKPLPHIGGTPQPTASASPEAGSCPSFSPKKYGIDANKLDKTGGGDQLVTVVAAEGSVRKAKLTAWDKDSDDCWRPADLDGVDQPLTAQVGKNGMKAFSKRRAGSGTTPTGLFPFGKTIYGNGPDSPNDKYKYHELQCGDWWNEQPGTKTYDSFQHVACGTTPSYGSASEALWTIGQAYEHFIPVTMPTPPDNAAGIFLHHNSNSGSTAGCIALKDGELETVLQWLDPDAEPHIRTSVG